MNIRDLTEQDLDGKEMLKFANQQGLFTLKQIEDGVADTQIEEQAVEVSPAEAEPTAEEVSDTPQEEETTVEQTAEETSQDNAEVQEAETEDGESADTQDNYNETPLEEDDLGI